MENISLDLIRVTEAAAIEASKLVGSGNKLLIDEVATNAMRKRLNEINFAAKVVISEGIKDGAAHLQGEYVGIQGLQFAKMSSAGSTPEFSEIQSGRPHIHALSIDSIDGTTQCAISGSEAISVLAIANENCMYEPKGFYMHKLAYGPAIKNRIELDILEQIEKTIEKAAFALDKKISNLMVGLLNRPRHDQFIARLRAMGVRLKLLQDCDVSGCISACLPDSGVDLFYGYGGAPESILATAAIKSLRGGFQSYEVDKNWNRISHVMSENELIKGDCVFVATGVLDGSILKGVRFKGSRFSETGCTTNSVFMRSKSGTIRFLETHHNHEI
jgi:fructose-1,6-bisphosphatase/sedoheptulose 1,7-bisphosphatase-like protein